MQLKEIIGWSPAASSEAEKIHSSFKPTLARGQHRFDQCYYFFWQLFLQRLYWTCCLYKHLQWRPFSSLDSPDIKYTLLGFESNKKNISSSSILSSHQDSSEGQEIELGNSFLVFDPAQVKGLVTLGDWQHLGGLGDRGPSELAVVIVEARRRSWWPYSWFELHHAGDGKRRLLVSTHCLCDMGGDITLCGCHNVD
jgi:hypothetical protein